MLNLDYNTIYAWCEDCNVHAGSPLSYLGELEGYPLVKSFNGTKFCGISAHNVVSIDYYRPSATTAMSGGLIKVINSGSFTLRKEYVENKSDIALNAYIRPTKNGFFRIQKEKTKNTMGVIAKLDENFICVRMIY